MCPEDGVLFLIHGRQITPNRFETSGLVKNLAGLDERENRRRPCERVGLVGFSIDVPVAVGLLQLEHEIGPLAKPRNEILWPARIANGPFEKGKRRKDS